MIVERPKRIGYFLLPLLLITTSLRNLNLSIAYANQPDNSKSSPPHSIQLHIRLNEGSPTSPPTEVNLLGALRDHFDRHSSVVLTNFELLDVSSNLLSLIPLPRQSVLGQLVIIDSITGLLRFTVPLDREQICPALQTTSLACTITILLTAENKQIESDPKPVYIDLTIELIDINDNSPFFASLRDQSNRVISIQEEGEIGELTILPTATDLDSLEHGVASYSFHPTQTSPTVLEHFEIVVRSGVTDCSQPFDSTSSSSGQIVPCLRTIARLDRETVSEFQFRLVATDVGGRVGEVDVKLVITDINDHSPRWRSRLETFDSTRGSQPILVDPFNLTESRHPDISNVDDVDNNPMITFNLPIRECTATHRKLIRLKATDEDDDKTSENGRVAFELDERGQQDQLRRRLVLSGDSIYLTDLGLQGLSQANLSLVVRAVDGGGLSSRALINLLVEDCNDHRPMISLRNTKLSVTENSQGTSHKIGLVTVRDFDAINSPNSQFHCSLNDTTDFITLTEVMRGPTIHDDLANHQSASSSKGQGRWVVYELATNPRLGFDREQTPVYSVLLNCIDNGSPPLASDKTLRLLIEDVNDNSPQFMDQSSDGSIEFRVAENAGKGVVVGRLQAIDKDVGDNARLEFSLVNDNQQLFEIATTGDIVLLDSLDRESEDEYKFKVMVSDKGQPNSLNATTNVVIHVEDVNDCRPEFDQNYEFNVTESYGSSTIHQLLGYLKATDSDLGRNGTITFRLAEQGHQDQSRSHLKVAQNRSNHRRPRHVVRLTPDGQLTIYGTLDRETTPILIVDVVAQDNGLPHRQSTFTTVTINVLDVNDNKPKFGSMQSFDSGNGTKVVKRRQSIGNPVEPVFKLNLSLDTGIGSMVAQFHANDPDEGPNGTVKFDLIYAGGISTLSSHQPSSKTDNSTEIPQYILHEDGRLILVKSLAYLQHGHRLVRHRRSDRLLVRASDSAPSPEQTITTLQILYHDPLPLNRRQEEAEEDKMTSPFRRTQPSGDHLQDGFDSNSDSLSSVSAWTDRNEGDGEPTSGLTRRRNATLTLIYLLATAVCFALLMVLLSLVYFYCRAKRRSSQRRGRMDVNGNKQYDIPIPPGSIIGGQTINNQDALNQSGDTCVSDISHPYILGHQLGADPFRSRSSSNRSPSVGGKQRQSPNPDHDSTEHSTSLAPPSQSTVYSNYTHSPLDLYAFRQGLYLNPGQTYNELPLVSSTVNRNATLVNQYVHHHQPDCHSFKHQSPHSGMNLTSTQSCYPMPNGHDVVLANLPTFNGLALSPPKPPSSTSPTFQPPDKSPIDSKPIHSLGDAGSDEVAFINGPSLLPNNSSFV